MRFTVSWEDGNPNAKRLGQLNELLARTYCLQQILDTPADPDFLEGIDDRRAAKARVRLFDEWRMLRAHVLTEMVSLGARKIEKATL